MVWTTPQVESRVRARCLHGAGLEIPIPIPTVPSHSSLTCAVLCCAVTCGCNVGVPFPAGDAGRSQWDKWALAAGTALRRCHECGGGKNEDFSVFASRSIAPSQYEMVRIPVTCEGSKPEEYVVRSHDGKTGDLSRFVPEFALAQNSIQGAIRDQSIFPSLDAAVSHFALTASKRRLRGADGGLARGAGGGWRPRAAMACRNTSKPCGMAKKTCEKLGRSCRKTYHRGAEPCKIEPLRKSILRGAGEPVRQLADRAGAPAPAASAVAWPMKPSARSARPRVDSVVPVATHLRIYPAICPGTPKP